jgi:hypothetical protein
MYQIHESSPVFRASKEELLMVCSLEGYFKIYSLVGRKFNEHNYKVGELSHASKIKAFIIITTVI